ncbi:rRNA pseudouridine synthase [Candidatus Woesearchaeota archaeon]|nr:rRNA pseudouridine synthase [Candidatus Woesearchaeota archaeon]
MERVQKIMAAAGIASRRNCEHYIEQGLVKVNGKIIKLGDKADATKDVITVEGTPLSLPDKIIIMLHKPTGYVTTVREDHDMKTVMDLVKVPQKVYPIGRLDKNTEGLLLLTNDGELANRLTHPRYEVKKEYYAVLDKPVSQQTLDKLRKGVDVEGRKVQFTSLSVLKNQVTLSIHEGRKHIVRKLFEKVGLQVKRLVRTKIAELELRDLPLGQWRELKAEDLRKLQTGR